MSSIFEMYKARSIEKRNEIKILFKYFGLDLRNKHIIELGTGYGDFLDICNEKGAKRIDFIERDNDFFCYNKKKNYKGNAFNIDYLKDLDKLFKFYENDNKADILYCKGGFSVDDLTRKKMIIRFFRVLDVLAKVIIITPHWENKEGKRFLEDQRGTEFFYLVTNNFNYSLMPFLEGYNTEPQYNMTFIKLNNI